MKYIHFPAMFKNVPFYVPINDIKKVSIVKDGGTPIPHNGYEGNFFVSEEHKEYVMGQMDK